MEIKVCPRCGGRWSYTAGHFFCHPRDMGDVIISLLATLKERGMSQRMVSAKLGVAHQTISAWKVGRQNPSPEHLAALKFLAKSPQAPAS